MLKVIKVALRQEFRVCPSLFPSTLKSIQSKSLQCEVKNLKILRGVRFSQEDDHRSVSSQMPSMYQQALHMGLYG